MRIVNGSTAAWILDVLEEYGQLPYSFLNLAPGVSHDTAKKALQSLLRAGYVEKKMPKEAIPAAKGSGGGTRSRAASAAQRQHAVLSITEKGFYAAFGSFDVAFSRNYHEHDKTRISANALVNEAALIMDLAGLRSYYQRGRAYKQQQRKQLERAADAIMGSRVAGIIETETANLMVYNFGTRNRKLNESAEAAMASSLAEQAAARLGIGYVLNPSMLILGAKDTTLLSILRLTETMRSASSKRFANIQAPFYLELSHLITSQEYFYLPVSRDVLPLLSGLHRANWGECCESVIRPQSELYQSCLRCACADYLDAKDTLEKYGQVEIHCYRWQVPILEEFLQSEHVTYHLYEPLEVLQALFHLGKMDNQLLMR